MVAVGFLCSEIAYADMATFSVLLLAPVGWLGLPCSRIPILLWAQMTRFYVAVWEQPQSEYPSLLRSAHLQCMILGTPSPFFSFLFQSYTGQCYPCLSALVDIVGVGSKLLLSHPSPLNAHPLF